MRQTRHYLCFNIRLDVAPFFTFFRGAYGKKFFEIARAYIRQDSAVFYGLKVFYHYDLVSKEILIVEECGGNRPSSIAECAAFRNSFESILRLFQPSPKKTPGSKIRKAPEGYMNGFYGDKI